MKSSRLYLVAIWIAALCLMGSSHLAQAEVSSTSSGTTFPRTTAVPAISFKNYPDHAFNVKEYIEGMQRGGHNLLIWKDPSADLSRYTSVKITEFGGRLLPEQNVFSYEPYIALFNSVFKSSIKQPQQDTPDALIIEGAVVECNPGSRAARYWVGMGAGKAAGAVVCEVYEPGKPHPCIRIYTRDTASFGTFGGDSVAMLNNIFSQLASRLATTLNSELALK